MQKDQIGATLAKGSCGSGLHTAFAITNACIYTHIHTYIHTYKHTYIHIYIYIYIDVVILKNIVCFCLLCVNLSHSSALAKGPLVAAAQQWFVQKLPNV